MNPTKKLSALAVAAALALGVAANAQAGVLAQGTLQITSLAFFNPDGTPVDSSQFSSLLFQDSSTITATLNGVPQTGTTSSTSLGPLDLPQQCVDNFGPGGPVCASFGQNNFSARLPPSTVDVARGDSLLVGAPVTFGGLPVPKIPPGLGADARLVAEAQLTTRKGDGNTLADLGLTATFTFVLASSESVKIQMNSLSHLIASLSPAIAGGTARAGESWTISITDGNTGLAVFRWAPDGLPGGIFGGTELVDTCSLTETRSSQTVGVTASYDCAGTHAATTGTLVAGTPYTLSIVHTNNAFVTLLPEPGTLALFGLGLAGLGFVGFRSRKLNA